MKTKPENSPATLSLLAVIRLEHMIRFKVAKLALEKLTSQERFVVTCIWKGFQDKIIADTMHLHIRTVQGHVRSILKKLGVGSRAEAAVMFERALHNDAGKLSPF